MRRLTSIEKGPRNAQGALAAYKGPGYPETDFLT